MTVTEMHFENVKKKERKKKLVMSIASLTFLYECPFLSSFTIGPVLTL